MGGRTHARRENIADESYGDGDAPVITVVPKSDETVTRIQRALEEHFLFSKTPRAARRKVVDAMQRSLVAPDEMIITQGDKGDKFYVLEIGRASVVVGGNVVADIEGPTAFGELALMYNSPRAASIKTTSFGVLWSLDRRSFRWTLADTSSKAQLEQCQFLKKVPLLSSLSNNEITRIAGVLQPVSYRSGEVIVREGDVGENFYIIADGEVLVKKQTAAGVSVTLSMLSRGQFFGEQALLHDEPRNATIEAMSSVRCLALARKHFDVVLGPLGEILAHTSEARDADTVEKLGPSAARSRGSGSAATSPARSSTTTTTSSSSSSSSGSPPRPASSIDPTIRFADVEKLTTIGTGTFGRVYMVEHRPTKRIMAMKVLQKQHIVRAHQLKNIMCEKRIMTEFVHPFTVRLFATFQDANRLYMLLELVSGGELWSLLYQAPVDALPRPTNGLEGISESSARFYAACVASAFKKIHSLGYVYRDLKPENLLVDRQGYIRVIDFGFTKRIPWTDGAGRHEKSMTLCGTPEYLSPELVLSKGHNRGVDHWALGILIYELLAAVTPFADDENQSNVFVTSSAANRS